MTINEIDSYLNENGINANDLWNQGTTIFMEISGDWKHDHLRTKWLMEGLGYEQEYEDVTEDTGCDWYPAIHKYVLSPRADALIRRHRKQVLEGHRHDLIAVYEWTKDETPADTVKALKKFIGEKNAIIAIAEAVNASEGDGRIYPKTREWAKTVEGSASTEELNQFELYSLVSWIHTSHLEQIAEEAMKVSAC